MKDDLLDSVVDGWKILIKVGQGASGAVYEARKEQSRAALKVIRPEAVDASTQKRFKREARLLMEIQHPHVIRCLAAGETGQFIYLALEFLDGGGLDLYLTRRKRFPVPVAVGIVRDLLDGLGAIHEKGIVHRDVKPANLLLDAQGTVKLADFNLARSETIDMNVTSDGSIVGTPFYMAPEQVEGKGIGPPTDLYAVGAVLYHLLIGDPPYEGSSSLSILQKHMHGALPEIKEKNPKIPDAIDAYIKSSMAKDPAERPQTAAEAKALLDGLETEPMQVDPRRRRRRRPPLPAGPPRSGTSSGRARRPGSESGRSSRPRPPSDKARRPPSGSGSRKRPDRSASDRRPRPPSDTARRHESERRRRPPPIGRKKRSTRSARRPSGSQHVAIPAEDGGIPLSDQRTAAMDLDQLREAAQEAEPRETQFPPARRKRLARAAPLPPPRRSKLLDALALLLLVVALAYGADEAVRRGEGKSPLADARARIAAGTPPANGSQKAADAVAKAFAAVDPYRLLFGLFVLLLVGDRVLARVIRFGFIGRAALGFKASRLAGRGEYHQAARTYEMLGKRLRAGDLLTRMGMHVLAAEFYKAGGYTELQAHALKAAGKDEEALVVLKSVASDAHTALAAASLGDTSRDAARTLLEQGMTNEAIQLHSRGGRHYEAAALLEKAGRMAEAAQELEAGYAKDSGREYWHFSRKDGLLEQAKPKLAKRIAKLYLGLGERSAAAKYMERAGDVQQAGDLYRDLGDHRGRARCLLHGIPPRGKLSPQHRELLDQAANALASVNDPQAVDLYVRAGNLRRAAELCREQRDYPQAAQLFARSGRHAEGAECAAKAGNRQLAAHLYGEGGDHKRAAELYEKLGQLEEAADAARAGDDFKNQARLYAKLGRHLSSARAWFRLGRGEDALEQLRRIPEQTDDWSEAQIIAADIHYNAGRFREAAEGYRELHPQIDLREEVGPTVRYATSLSELGRFDEALGVLARFDKNRLAPRDLAKRKAAIRAKAGKATGAPARPGQAPAAPAADSLASVSRPQELIGQRLDRYTIEELLGDSAFTWVYRAKHERLGRDVVFKILKPAVNVGQAGQHFLEEGRHLIGKPSKHIVEVQDGGEARGLSYLAFELVPGPTLEETISQEAPLPIPLAAHLGAGILEALHIAHQAGVIHHDLKPSRVRISNGSVAKVADFGVAKVFEEVDGAGSYVDPRYASPEQALGEDPGESADLYAAALILYEMLTGRLPFESKTPRGYWTLHANERPPSIRKLRKDIPRPFANAIMRGLSKSPTGRFPTAGAFAKAISAFAKAPAG